MSFSSIEGVHYILDRYTVLNDMMADGDFKERITPDSPAKEIARVVKLARALYHPDRQARSGKTMQEKAERNTHLIEECERFLSAPDIKPLYDAKLAQFQKDRPDLVSTDGLPIIDLSSPVLDMDSLLSDDVRDTSTFEAYVKDMSGYDEGKMAQMKALYDTMPDNPQIKTVYRDMLGQKLAYFDLLEDAAWAKLGYINRKNKTDGHVTSSDSYAEKVEEALQNAATRDIESGIEQRGDAARIGLATLPLLLTFNPAAGAAPSTALMDPVQMQAMMQDLKNRARKNFEIRADYVRDVARQKQAVMEELVTLSTVYPINKHKKTSPLYDFYLVSADDPKNVLFRLELNAKTGQATMGVLDRSDLTLSDLKAQKLTRNSFVVERNVDISDILIETTAASERVFQDMKATFEKPHKPRAPKTPRAENAAALRRWHPV
ncbi:hypothetical protein [Micavibrio aeruginosavorus]|uniref:hypothetical protein n=1 Tax=Micavibrio aeruginosavorus TaxID=349221 RepID=UPI003F4AAEA4